MPVWFKTSWVWFLHSCALCFFTRSGTAPKETPWIWPATQLHGCPLALLALLVGVSREELKGSPTCEESEKENKEGQRGIGWEFGCWVFPWEGGGKKELERRLLWENSLPKTLVVGILSRSQVFRPTYGIWLSCTVQLSSQKLLKRSFWEGLSFLLYICHEKQVPHYQMQNIWGRTGLSYKVNSMSINKWIIIRLSGGSLKIFIF